MSCPKNANATTRYSIHINVYTSNNCLTYLPTDLINHKHFDFKSLFVCLFLTFLLLQFMSYKTSLKIFKHYKLKPSFSIIKDEKAKNKVGVGDKPPPQSFNNLVKFDPIWSSLIQFIPIWSNLIKFVPSWNKLIQFNPI